jgi:hypothetical protein
MKMDGTTTIQEPARDTPVYGSCDVLVVGAGPAGTAAAVAAAREGADVVLIERYGHLGGLSTGGLVSWIDRMADWNGELVVAGIGKELVDRCGPDATIGPPQYLWGSRDVTAAQYWRVRTAGLNGVVQWSPTVDPEVLKLVTNDIVREARVHVLMHCWVVGTICEGRQVQGVLFESKQGRFAVMAPAVIDGTGDGDVFAQAGAAFDDDFRMMFPEEYKEAMRKASQEGLSLLAHATPYESVALFLTPKMAGYSALNIADLTEVEFVCRDVARKGLEFYRKHVPGFERAWIHDTASQIGTRHARRLVGVERITIEHWRTSGLYRDSIGLCPGVTEKFPTLQIPYRCMVPREVEGVLAAGRNLSADTKSHAALREIPECWVMGEAAGIAGAMAVAERQRLRDVSVPELQRRLLKRGAIIEPPGGAVERVPDDGDTQLEASIHWRAVDDVRAHE